MRRIAAFFAILALSVPAFAQVNNPGVNGPSSATSGHLATYNGASGKLIQDGGAVPTSATTANVAAAVGVNGAVASNGTSSFSQAACANLTNATAYCNAAIGQLPGTATNDNASAGNLGEYISTNVPSGSPVSLSNATPANLGSISLTPGDWDVSLQALVPLSSATVSYIECSISATSATVDSTLGRTNESLLNVVTTSLSPGCGVSARRFSVSTNTTVYAVFNTVFSAGSVAVYGTISARRAR